MVSELGVSLVKIHCSFKQHYQHILRVAVAFKVNDDDAQENSESFTTT